MTTTQNVTILNKAFKYILLVTDSKIINSCMFLSIDNKIFKKHVCVSSLQHLDTLNRPSHG